MSESLAALRKAASLTQEDLGKAIARRLKRRITSYAQKKVARFEAGTAVPAEDELKVMADELGVEPDHLRSLLPIRGPQEADSIFGQLPENGRCLVASCLLSRPRPQALDETTVAIKNAIETKNLKIAAFMPYPTAVHSVESSDHVNHLVFGYYAGIRRSILEANLFFKNLLSPEHSNAVALYAPKSETVAASSVLLPPVFHHQYSLTIQIQPNGMLTKTLHSWTPGEEADLARSVKATSVFSLDEQVDAWQAYFGQVMHHWIETGDLLVSDAYWLRIR